MASTQTRRVIAASLVGTSLEWYDFFLYGSAAALVFNKLFFPTFEPLTGTLLAFLTYAIGFVARPLGGIVFGHFGDRVGRKNVLVVTLLLMGIATFLIGLLPGYATIGVTAPLLLVTLRFLQGLGLGGEWGGAVLMSIEHGDPRRRGFNASWPQVGVPAGNLLAAACSDSCRRRCRRRRSCRGAGGCPSSCRACWWSWGSGSACGSWSRRCSPRSSARARRPGCRCWTCCARTRAPWSPRSSRASAWTSPSTPS
ncbi:MFS transporter [Streptosporangium lutulentum]